MFLFVYKLCCHTGPQLVLSKERGGGIHWFGHTQKRSTPITKDAKDVCVCVFWVCAGVAGAAQCPWGNVHLLSSASALESPAVRSHSMSSPQRPALPAWEEGAVWEHGILGGAVFPVWPFPSVPPKGGGGAAIPTAPSPSLCEGRTQEACRRRKQEQKRDETATERDQKREGREKKTEALQKRHEFVYFCVAFMLSLVGKWMFLKTSMLPCSLHPAKAAAL